MVGMTNKSEWESDNRILAPEEEDRCKKFGTIDIPTIIITILTDLLFIIILLLLYKLSGGKYVI